MTSEHRIFSRHPVYSNLVLIDAPSVSDVLLSPRDISFGGFMIESPRELEAGEEIECAIEIEGKNFPGCRATAAWRVKNQTDPPTWNVGFSVQVPENLQADFEDAMKQAFPAEEHQEEY